MGLGGLEPPASSLSGMRSNQAELQALLEITAQKHKPSAKKYPRICPITRNAGEKGEQIREPVST